MMTDPTSTRTRFWLPLLSRQALYVLSTDQYPWSDICADLDTRPFLSAVLEARQAGRRGRFLWRAGDALGGFDSAADLSMTTFMRAFPRATLQLSLIDPAVASLAWQCRSVQPEALASSWPEAQNELARSGFGGALLGGEGQGAVSYWQAGKPVAGTLPLGGAVYTVSAPQLMTSSGLCGFWSQVLALAAAQAPELPATWRTCAAELAGQHPCLDPFVRDVWLDQLSVHAVPDLSISELREALLAVFDMALRRVKVRVRALPVAELQASPLWAASGAGDLP